MRRITGTHVYGFVKCPALAARDLHLERDERRPPHPWEEFAARRGRDFEAEFVAGMTVVQPDYPERDFAAGAAATMALLREGHPWVYQAVLATDERLGLPDLLRRVDGDSALGGFHYEVVDVKSSGRARADQILQVTFYSRLLAAVQGRLPARGALVLKTGREENFAVAEFDAVCAAIEERLLAIRGAGGGAVAAVPPFLQRGCDGCHWNHLCVPAMRAAGDLSLVPGMSHGARAILQGLGCRTVADLARFQPEGSAARGHLDATLLRRLRRGAEAVLAGRPLRENTPRRSLDPAAIVHLLFDPFAERLLAIGSLYPAMSDGVVRVALPRGPAGEVDAFKEVLAGIPGHVPLLHYGEPLPRWYDEQSHRREARFGFSGRFADLRRLLRGAAVFPGPVFGLADHVRLGLQRDPLRFGHAGEAASWVGAPDGGERLARKLRGDLDDLAALKVLFLPDPVVVDGGAPRAEAGLGT